MRCQVANVDIEPQGLKRARTLPGEANEPHETTDVWKPLLELLQRKSQIRCCHMGRAPSWGFPRNSEAVSTWKHWCNQGSLDRLLLGEEAWRDQLPSGHSIVQKRFTHEIFDLGLEVWSELTRKRACHKEVPRHIMLRLFSRDDSRPDHPKIEPTAGLQLR